MKLNIKALALVAGSGRRHVHRRPYQHAVPAIRHSIPHRYSLNLPGHQPFTGFTSVIIGTIYGFVDAAIGVAIFGWVYNYFTK